MHVIIVPDDSLVIVDGDARACSFTAPAAVHAIDWDGETGYAQRRASHGGGLVPIASIDELEPYLEAWRAAAPEQDAAPEPIEQPHPDERAADSGAGAP